jgi:hypothetical protein
VKDLRDQSEAIRAYVRQRHCSLEAMNLAAELKVRAERKLVTLLAGRVQPGNPQLSHAGTNGKLPDGINRNQSSRWQQLAAIPAPVFEQKVAEAKETGEVTTARLLRFQDEARRQAKRADLERRTGAARDAAPAGRIDTADCLAGLAGLEAGSVRPIFADPPYNIGVNYGEGRRPTGCPGPSTWPGSAAGWRRAGRC